MSGSSLKQEEFWGLSGAQEGPVRFLWAEAPHGLFSSKELFPPEWFGFLIFKQLGLHLLQ